MFNGRRTPDELRIVADRQGLDGKTRVGSSRLTAKINNNCIAHGFQIYLHSFVLAASGEWAVIQQEMNITTGFGRRCRWDSASAGAGFCA
jgi:hypothetical protein